MNRKWIVVALIVIAFVFGLLASKFVFTGNAVKDVSANYTWTKAICDRDNNCIDVEISCENGNVVKVVPVTGIVDHPKNWSDPRGEMANVFCE